MTTTVTALKSAREQVAALAATQITGWQRGYLADQARAVAVLARLRRGAGRPAGQLPDLWELIDTSRLHQPAEDARKMSEAELTRAEDALHVTYTVWALHQQSRPTGMHQTGRAGADRGLGAAVRRLMKPGEISEPARKRLVRAGTAADLASLAVRLRDIVTVLRRQDLPLDYGLLAGQLSIWQQPGGPERVRVEWGRSFHAYDKTTTAPAGTGPDPAAGTSTGTDFDDRTDLDKDAS
ncbi:type I-E CRISPR-associated protein Cse2/CasB [Streptomyces sp. ISL-12]|uniref:type I-E CRISPR-associated protein Cse2/CasB n=1 Tax=Streptomyces sp. ISL-12 TaxID=2819177 RepID=UPI001BEB044A|nr:type I-E CRISPR-associated protein Cse2/CasB [Streptomyces sp. ISL-12]MBT2415792.1 type I-E CRISPR-associated protein Cse2/CasB [Streptomyces sp. ISL-12]